MADIKSYRPSSTLLSSGQVLARPYPFAQARLVIAEMTEELMLELLEKRLAAEAIVLQLGRRSIPMDGIVELRGGRPDATSL